MDFAQLMQVWVSASLMVFVLSFLHSENPLYRLAEHIYVGAAAGYFIVIGIQSVYSLGIVQILKGNAIYFVPIVAGLLMFATFAKKTSWTVRYPMALLIGVGAGLALRATPKAQIFDQIADTITIIGRNPSATFDNIIVFVAVITATIYFIFTREIKGFFAHVPKVGRFFLMIAFGAAYGGTILMRLGQFVPQMQFLLSRDTLMATGVALMLVIAVLGYSFTKTKQQKTKREDEARTPL